MRVIDGTSHKYELTAEAAWSSANGGLAKKPDVQISVRQEIVRCSNQGK